MLLLQASASKSLATSFLPDKARYGYAWEGARAIPTKRDTAEYLTSKSIGESLFALRPLSLSGVESLVKSDSICGGTTILCAEDGRLPKWSASGGRTSRGTFSTAWLMSMGRQALLRLEGRRA